MGDHHLIHDPLAGRALAGRIEAVAEDDLALPVCEGDEEKEAVVARGVTELPAVEEVGGEAAVGLAGRGQDDDDHHVGLRRLLDRPGEPFDLRGIGGGERAGLVNDAGLRA